jgi:hypothetical protein
MKALSTALLGASLLALAACGGSEDVTNNAADLNTAGEELNLVDENAALPIEDLGNAGNLTDTGNATDLNATTTDANLTTDANAATTATTNAQ